MTRVSRPIAATITAILAALALAACGGTSVKAKNAYAEKVNAAQQKFAASVSDATRKSGGTSVPQQEKTLRRFLAAIDGVVRQLRAIKAPSDVSKEHQRLTSIMADFGKAIGSADEAMRNRSPQGIELAKGRLRVATQSVNAHVAAAIAAINAKLQGK